MQKHVQQQTKRMHKVGKVKHSK